MNKLAVSHFYIRYLDVGWNEHLSMPLPLGQLDAFRADNFVAGSYTPVVFITNRVFEQITDNWIDTVAKKITAKVKRTSAFLEETYCYHEAERRLAAAHLEYEKKDSIKELIAKSRTGTCTELQIDCDWTAKTKEKYFRFLAKLKALNPGITLSATIRLYPYKYPEKMGVPPVDRGMLMCYNLGSIKSVRTNNSIFDIEEMEPYFNGAAYPLPLDVALPVFSWQVWFRGGQYKGIVHSKIEPGENSTAFTQTTKNILRVNTDTVINDNYYREGDEFRLEEPDPDQLIKAMALLDRKLPGYSRITFFDWDLSSINRYETTIQKIFDTH